MKVDEYIDINKWCISSIKLTGHGDYNHGYYISAINEKYQYRYLHKNMTINDCCGVDNMWRMRIEAEDFLKKYKQQINFISEKEMMI